MTDNFKGFIFDLDGTLLDSMYVWNKVDLEFLGKRGFEVPPDYIDVITPLGFRETAKYTIDRFGVNENEDDIIDEWTNTAIDEYSRNVKFKDGAREFLNLLREKGKKIAVATATMPELCFSALKNHGLENFFDNITFITEVGRGKGFPDVYLKAAEKLGISPDECAVFEDIPAGIAGAKLGGFYTVGVYEKTSEHLSDIMKSTSDKFIYSFRDILV